MAEPALPVRRAYLDALAGVVSEADVVVSAFGDSTRDWAAAADRGLNLYLLGGMGHAISVALGVALAEPSRRVVCCETDGGLLLNLGSLVTLAGSGAGNLSVVVFDNGCYESSGGQPLPGAGTDLVAVARGAGIGHAERVESVDEFDRVLREHVARDAPSFLDVRVAVRSTPREPFERHPLEIRERFRVALAAARQPTSSKEGR